jgi:hypothetical protein
MGNFYLADSTHIISPRNSTTVVLNSSTPVGRKLHSSRTVLPLVELLSHAQSFDLSRHKRMIVIALLLEEIIPLIAIYVPSMLPSTCVLPTQRQRIDEKRAEKAHSFALEHRHVYAELRRSENPAGYLPLESLYLPGASTAICG